MWGFFSVELRLWASSLCGLFPVGVYMMVRHVSGWLYSTSVELTGRSSQFIINTRNTQESLHLCPTLDSIHMIDTVGAAENQNPSFLKSITDACLVMMSVWYCLFGFSAVLQRRHLCQHQGHSNFRGCRPPLSLGLRRCFCPPAQNKPVGHVGQATPEVSHEDTA